MDAAAKTHYTIGMNIMSAKYRVLLLAIISLGVMGRQPLYGAAKTSAAAVSDSMPFKLNTGIGSRISNFMLNYGFIPMGQLGSVQRMSVMFRFGETGGGAIKPVKTAGKKSLGAWAW